MIYGAGVIGEKHEKAGLTVEKFEIRKRMRMHCVVRKPKGGQL